MTRFFVYLSLLLLSSFLLQASTLCKEGSIRLVGDFLLEGRVETCSRGEWGTICDNQWDNQDATVVCRELGFSDEGSLALNGTYVSRNIGSGVGSIVLRKVECSGKETRLKDCQTSYALCFRPYDAGVRCRHKGEPVLAFNKQIYPNNSVIDLESISTAEGIQSSIACITDNYPCCDTKDGWYAPNNTDRIHHTNFFVTTFLQSVVLHRVEGKYVPNGIFRCEMKDSRGATQRLYIGVYLQGLGMPTITSLKFERSTRTFICSSIGGPSSNISWSKDGDPLNVTGYRESQTILDTGLAIYENRLTVPQAEVNVTGLYTCTVINRRGSSTADLLVEACGDGEVLTEQGSEEVAQICSSGHFYDVVEAQNMNIKEHLDLMNDTSQSNCNGGKTWVAAYALGGLLGVSFLTNAVIVVLCLCLLSSHKKHTHQDCTYDHPTHKLQPDELHNVEREVQNEIYGMKGEAAGSNSDTDSMVSNQAYGTMEVKSHQAVDNLYQTNNATDINEVIYEFPNQD